MIFNERVREMRLERGLSQSKLARMIGVVDRNYQRYEQPDNVPSYRHLLALADALEVSVDYLMGRTDKKEINR